MKTSSFLTNKKYFHVSLHFESNKLFKNLDWLFIQKKLSIIAKHYKIEVQSLVMMDTHIHLLIATKEKNENFFCETLQKNISNTNNLESLAEPVLHYSQYLNTYKYIYRNPVEAGLCEKVENYEYSTLRALIGKAILNCNVHDQMGLIQNPLHLLKWLNTDVNYKISRLAHINQSKIQSADI
jgi:REP element-mobilizing transposase RayT